jgi:hypothetical protein|tara:strand:+ start:5281 stop:5673 length:393 start_codon:yes stop_codon:yes gene_type:complete
MDDINLPIIELPEINKIETISIPLPTADVPSYVPLVVPPSDLQAEEEIEGEASEETEQPGMRKIDIPVIDIKMPVPETEILVTATTTAVVSVAATLTATAAFKWVVTAMKPILKTAWKKLSQRKKVSLEK